MNIRDNNQHDYYGQACSTMMSVQQFAASFIKMHDAISKCMSVIKRAMIEELENEKKEIDKLK